MVRYADGQGLGEGTHRGDGSASRAERGRASRQVAPASNAARAGQTASWRPPNAAARVVGDHGLCRRTDGGGRMSLERHTSPVVRLERSSARRDLPRVYRSQEQLPNGEDSGGERPLPSGLRRRRVLSLASPGRPCSEKEPDHRSFARPKEFIVPLARGLFDGDGHVANFIHAPTRAQHRTIGTNVSGCISTPEAEPISSGLVRS